MSTTNASQVSVAQVEDQSTKRARPVRRVITLWRRFWTTAQRTASGKSNKQRKSTRWQLACNCVAPKNLSSSATPELRPGGLFDTSIPQFTCKAQMGIASVKQYFSFGKAVA